MNLNAHWKSDWTGTSRSVGQTLELGRLLAGCLRDGDVLALDGELGAGKTQLVRGLAEGLGLSSQQVASPTFVLVHEYRRQDENASALITPKSDHLPGVLVHIDAYRLRCLEDLESIGWSSHESDAADVLMEMRRGAVVVIEWAEKLGSALGEDMLRVRLEHRGQEQRQITLHCCGNWRERQESMTKALAAWSQPTSPCPICGQAVQGDGEQFPFCSKRCRMVDLGKWLGGDYRISRPVELRDLEEGMD